MPTEFQMPDFYDSQNKETKVIIAAIFEKSTDLGNASTLETTLFHEFRKIFSNHNEHKVIVE